MENEEKELEQSTAESNKKSLVEVQYQKEQEAQPEIQNQFEIKVNQVQQEPKSSDPKKKSSNKKSLLWIFIIILLLGIVGLSVYGYFNSKKETVEINNAHKQNKYRISGNNLENFDLYFLQLENKEENTIYSPLSIKYALAMLNEGTDGTTNEEIKNLIGDYNANKYTNSDNMSLANALFIRNSFKESIKEDYTNKLTNKYNAEVIFDEFNTPDNINNWISKKTFNLINNLLDDVSGNNYILINALAIDMEWEEKFILYPGRGVMVEYSHEKDKDGRYSWWAADSVSSSAFENVTDKISGMEIKASLNNYDIISELGEESIRKIVGDAYREYLTNPEGDWVITEYLNNDTSSENVEKVINEYLNDYIESISYNYKKIYKTTDFSFYVDDDVKVFAKDLKEYNGTTLQYVGVMPINENLNTYVKNTDAEKIKALISGLKTLEINNVEKGAITEISGYIPKFKFEYTLDLMKDLKKLGVNEVFDSSKANLSKISSANGNYISDVKHKANIEFTQDGIKAAAATEAVNIGAGGSFDYLFEVPVIKIDLTFDKPYMFLIRDKKTGEVWFTGTVYNPLLWKDDPSSACAGNSICID